MIKEISMYGLLLNLGIAFGAPHNREDVEAFIKAKRDKIQEVERNGLLEFPMEIILKEGCSFEDFEEYEDLIKDPYEASAFILGEEHATRTAEEQKQRLKKYSKPASGEELALVKAWGVKDLHVVDFDSIVNGLKDEAQKLEARKLITADEATLYRAIDEWVEERGINPLVSARILAPIPAGEEHAGALELVGRIVYELKPEDIANMRHFLSDTLKFMSHYRSSKEVLALSLVLLKDLKVDAKICHFFTQEYLSVMNLYYNLRERLFDRLGIEAKASFVGDLDSKLERDLFRFIETLPDVSDIIEIPRDVLPGLINDYLGDETTEVVKISRQKFYKIFQIALLWCRFDELWDRIGFANVDGVIYVNRMSDLNLLQVPVLFKIGSYKVSTYDSKYVQPFLELMDENIEKDMSVFFPTAEAWKVWMQLQKRDDHEVGYFSAFKGTLEDFMAFAETVKLRKL
ncbi:MAG: hypothetical protein ACSW8C_02930 [bacterium]